MNEHLPRPRHRVRLLLIGALLAPGVVGVSTTLGQDSLMARSVATSTPQGESGEPHALRDMSLFAIAPPEPRAFEKHDLIQIIVRESSSARSTHELELEKEWAIDGKIDAFPNLQLADILNFQLYGGRTDNLPAVKMGIAKGFDGDGDYEREDDLAARLTAEVVEVLPNGNLVLEAKTIVKNDDETSTIRVTGVCRPDDITAANSVVSSLIHDLRVEKVNEGQLKETNEKGILAKFFDMIFAF